MKRALVIEDDENNYVLIADLLQHAGYTPLKAVNGHEGVRKAVKDCPDFILLDIQLPDLDGFEVLHQIRSAAECNLIPVIAMTSYAMSGDRERLLDAGCNGYLEKPLDPLRVITQIGDMLEATA